MSFHDWLYSVYPPNSSFDGKYKAFHILTMVFIVVAAVAITYFLRSKKEKHRYTVLVVISSVILLLEITRRIVAFTKGDSLDFTLAMRALLPRPWCAISCWILMIATLVRKKFMYNLAACNGIVCALVFFAYPSVGFNNTVILFENVYSIVTHTMLMLGAILCITLKFTSFKYYEGSLRKSAIWELLSMVIIFAYAFIEIYVLKIEADPLYFRSGNEVQDFLGCSYPVYLLIYSGFLIFYFNLFYIIDGLVRRRKLKKSA